MPQDVQNLPRAERTAVNRAFELLESNIQWLTDNANRLRNQLDDVELQLKRRQTELEKLNREYKR